MLNCKLRCNHQAHSLEKELSYKESNLSDMEREVGHLRASLVVATKEARCTSTYGKGSISILFILVPDIGIGCT